jgi:hypothetical protein
MPRTFQDIVWPRFDDTIFDTDYYPARAKAQLAQEIVNATARRAWPEEEETSYRPTAREQIARELLARAQEERAWRIQVKRQRRKAQRDWWQAHGLWVLVGLAAALAVLGLIDWDRVLGL